MSRRKKILEDGSDIFVHENVESENTVKARKKKRGTKVSSRQHKTRKRKVNGKKEVQATINKYINTNMFNTDEVLGRKDTLGKVLYKGLSLDPHTVEIRLGNAFALICRELAILKHGKDCVPEYIAGAGVSQEEADEYWNKYKNKASRKADTTILSKIDPSKVISRLPGAKEITSKYGKDSNGGQGGKLTHKSFSNIRDDYFNVCKRLIQQKKIYLINCDLVIKKGKKIFTYEIKSSGSVDTGKRDSILIKDMLLPGLIIGKGKINSFYAMTRTNFDKSNLMKTYLAPECMLTEDFLDSLLPKNMSVEDFINMLKSRMVDLDKKNKNRIRSRKRRLEKILGKE
jgi:hypothetical protein